MHSRTHTSTHWITHPCLHAHMGTLKKHTHTQTNTHTDTHTYVLTAIHTNLVFCLKMLHSPSSLYVCMSLYLPLPDGHHSGDPWSSSSSSMSQQGYHGSMLGGGNSAHGPAQSSSYCGIHPHDRLVSHRYELISPIAQCGYSLI